jgi:hypothetical protein
MDVPECMSVRKQAMAKRTPRSQASDSAATRAQPKTRRSRPAAPDDTIGAYPGVERSEDDGMIARAVTATEPPASRPIGSGPSDEEIRTRAYHRFLERGANDGMAFEDWLAAEQELRESKVRS